MLKRSAEALLARVGRATDWRMRGRSLVLAYHNILEPGSTPGRDGSLHLERAVFARQLDYLLTCCEVVAVESVLAPAAAGDRPRVAITFDDAYLGSLTAGVAELRERGLPATVFVTPGFLGGNSFWWDDIRVPAGAGLSDHLREELLTRHGGQDERIRAATDPRWSFDAGGSPARTGTEADLHAAAAYPGLSFAPHSWSHPNLATVTGSRLAEELERPRSWLTERFPRVLPLLAYPYGLTAPHVERAAAAAGYTAAFRVSGGWLPQDLRGRYRFPRLGVAAQLSLDGFAARLAGLLW